MEYLMSYGWAILIIAVVLGALFQLGVFNSSSFAPRAPPGSCQVFRPGGPGTITNINLMGVCTGLLPQYAAQFNGQNGYVRVSPFTGIQNSAFTISLWINPTGFPAVYSELLYGGYGGSGGWDVLLGSAGGLSFCYTTGSNHCVNCPSITTGKWYSVVAVSTGSNEYCYANGATTTPDATAFTPSATYLYIGARSGSTYFFNGIIANLQAYNASLSANEVQALYLQGIGGAPLLLQNLVGWWPLNGNANDYSGNNNNGVPTAVTFTSQYGK